MQISLVVVGSNEAGRGGSLRLAYLVLLNGLIARGICLYWFGGNCCGGAADAET